MTTQTIKVEVPEGMEIDKTTSHIVDENIYMIRLQKIQPRRIVLELTPEEYGMLKKIPIEQRLLDNPVMLELLVKIKSAEVKETDIPLTNEEPKF